MAPSNKSPLLVVVAFPLLAEAVDACPAAVTSREFDGATPAYSRIAKRKVPEIVSDTVIVFAPAAMFSA
jgi:hypothetical protein